MSCSELLTLNDFDKCLANGLESNDEVLNEFLEAHNLNDQFKALLYFTETGQIDNYRKAIIMIDTVLSKPPGIQAMKSLDIGIVMSKCLECPIEDISKLAIRSMLKACKSSEGTYFKQLIQVNEALQNTILFGLDNENATIMKACQEILNLILIDGNKIIQHSFIDRIIDKIHKTKDTVLKIRYCDAIFNFAVIMKASFFTDYKDFIIETIDLLKNSSDDFLFQINLLELLIILLEVDECIELFQSIKFYDYIIKSLGPNPSNIYQSFLQKPFTDILIQTYCHTNLSDELKSKLPSILHNIFHDVLLLSEGPDVLYYIGKISQCLNKSNKELESLIINDEDIIKQISLLCYSTNDQMKCVALSSLSSLISSLYDSVERIQYIMKIFCNVKNIDNYMDFIMKVLKDPFPECHIAVFDLLLSLINSKDEEIVRNILCYGGFQDFLLNRQTERTKDAMEWKYSLLKCIYEVPNKFDYFLNEQMELLEKEFKLGPYAGITEKNTTERDEELITI